MLSGNGNGARILLYHSIGKQEKYDAIGLRISEESFTRQMEYLAGSSFDVVSLPSLIENLRDGGITVGRRTVAITFDDGYRDNLEKAMPIAKRFNFPISLFVNCDSSRQVRSNINNDYWSKWGYLSMDEINGLASATVTIGSHSFSHRTLDCKREEIYKEIQASKEVLEKEIGQPVTVFSYPHGIFTDVAKQAVREAGFLGACSSIMGTNNSSTDLFELRRTEISAFDTLDIFKKKLGGYYDWLGAFQRRKFHKK